MAVSEADAEEVDVEELAEKIHSAFRYGYEQHPQPAAVCHCSRPFGKLEEETCWKCGRRVP